MQRVVIATPTRERPHSAYLAALADSVPLLSDAGWEDHTVYEIGCPYISHARATLLRKALDAKADAIICIDDDLSWEPQALAKLLEIEAPVVAGVYRFKKDKEEYMGEILSQADGTPLIEKSTGCIVAHSVPGGMLKITPAAVNRFIQEYPDLCYGQRHTPNVDLFNHGAHDHVWYGEDYAFSRRWREKCGQLLVRQDIDITHHQHGTNATYPGNFHEFLLRQPGGSKDPEKCKSTSDTQNTA